MNFGELKHGVVNPVCEKKMNFGDQRYIDYRESKGHAEFLVPQKDRGVFPKVSPWLQLA